MQFGAEDLAWATQLVGRRMPPTPQYVWPLLAEHVGAEVWVKHENHTPTGRLLFLTTQNVAEPAGAIVLAGLLAERSSAAERRVAVILTAGSADADQFRSVLDGHTPAP